jgi:hypothetical protein
MGLVKTGTKLGNTLNLVTSLYYSQNSLVSALENHHSSSILSLRFRIAHHEGQGMSTVCSSMVSTNYIAETTEQISVKFSIESLNLTGKENLILVHIG